MEKIYIFREKHYVNKLACVKAVRETFVGMSLTEAKPYVETFCEKDKAVFLLDKLDSLIYDDGFQNGLCVNRVEYDEFKKLLLKYV